MYNILMPDARFEDEPEIERAVVGSEATLEVHKENKYQAVPAASWERCNAIIIHHKVKVDAALLDRAPRIRIVVRAGVGHDNVDLRECGRRGSRLHTARE